MYKFTNGIVVFDEETRDAYIKAGMHLVEEKKEKKAVKEIEKKEEETVDEEKTDVLFDEEGNDEVRSSTKEDRKKLREEC